MAWRLALLKASRDPSKILFENDLMSVIADPYPKAEKHYLLVSKKDISTISHACNKDLEILYALDEKGRELAEQDEGRNYKIGYHSEPSMERLHLHVISDDFNSVCLKNLRHWNSFNTEFFIDSERAIKDIETLGKVDVPDAQRIKELLNTRLQCHKCEYIPQNLPKLKLHIKSHFESG